MAQLTTTYRHDFVPPLTNRYRFLQENKQKNSTDCKKICDCGPKLEDSELKKTGNLQAEWTGIAPKGRLVNPKIAKSIPDNTLEDKEASCLENQPNRFLKILRNCYPNVYERLRQLPAEDLTKRLNNGRLKTSYQIDFGHVSEYPGGLYEESENVPLDPTENCVEDDKYVDENEDPSGECIKSYRPPKITFVPNNESKDSTGHWGFADKFDRKPKMTEYQETIAKTGCIIVKNDLHNHSKCNRGKNCAHKIK